MDQEKYLNDILERFKMEDAKSVTTPAVPGNMAQDSNSTIFHDKKEYMSLVGSLIYLSVVTKPDTTFAVGRAGQAMSNPTEANWIELRGFLGMLKKKKHLDHVIAKLEIQC
jgi:hypothetical protein